MKDRIKENQIIFILLGIIFLVQSCAHAISKKMRDQAIKDLTFLDIKGDPDRYIGKTVILGGIIIEVTNHKEGTSIKVLQTPIDSREEPQDPELSQGRFIIKTPSYLDPEIYRKGRKVSVAGKIIGKEVHPVGEISYTYPLIWAEEIHLWRERTPTYPWGYYPHPFYWDYWDWYFYGPPFRPYPFRWY